MFSIYYGTNNQNMIEYGKTQRCTDSVKVAWELFKENSSIAVFDGHNKLIYSISTGVDALRAKITDNRKG